MKKLQRGWVARLLTAAALTLGFSAAAELKLPVPGTSNIGIYFSGSGFLDAFLIGQKEDKSWLFAGKFIENLINVSSLNVPDHTGNVWLSLDRAKFNTSLRAGNPDTFIYSVNTVLSNGPRTLQQFFFKLEGPKAGTVLLGNTKGIEIQMSQAPESFIGATGGIDGVAPVVVNLTTGCDMTPYMVGETGDSTKVSYITPRIKGLQLGVSFTPDTRHWGTGPMNTAWSSKTDPLKTFDLNHWAFGVNYATPSTSRLLFAASAFYMRGDRKPERPGVVSLQRFPVRSYDISAVISWDEKWFLGVEYIYSGNSGNFRHDDMGQKDDQGAYQGLIPELNSDGGTIQRLSARFYRADLAGKNTTISGAIGYVDRTGGKFSVSLSYLRNTQHTGFVSEVKDVKSGKAKGDAIVFSFEKFLTPHISAYTELGRYEMINPDALYFGHKVAKESSWEFTAVPSNTAYFALLGLKLKF